MSRSGSVPTSNAPLQDTPAPLSPIQNQSSPGNQPTPPPSPSRNRNIPETDKKHSPTNKGRDITTISPATSPKQTPIAYACPGSPSRNYSYYTSSSAELTPPGSPMKTRSGNNQPTSPGSVSNKSNTVVWHQGTPPSSPQRSVRRTRSTSIAAPTPKQSPQTSPKSDATGTKRHESAHVINTVACETTAEKLSLKTARARTSKLSPTQFRSNITDQTIPEEKLHKRTHASLKRDKILQEIQRRHSSSKVIVKVTSPTTPPKSDNSPDKPSLGSLPAGENVKIVNSTHTENESINSLKVVGKLFQRGQGLFRQSSLPDDGLHPYDINPAYDGVGGGGHQPPVVKSFTKENEDVTKFVESKYVLENTARTDTETSISQNQFAKIDGTVSDSSFNSATLSYATLFYAPRNLSAPYHSRIVPNSKVMANFSADSCKAVHVVRISDSNKNKSGSVQHRVFKEQSNDFRRPTSSSILRARFASHQSKSLEIEATETDRSSNSKRVSVRNKNLNISNGCIMNNAPSLPALPTVSESDTQQKILQNSSNDNVRSERFAPKIYGRNCDTFVSNRITRNSDTSNNKSSLKLEKNGFKSERNISIKTFENDVNCNFANTESATRRTILSKDTSTKVHLPTVSQRIVLTNEQHRISSSIRTNLRSATGPEQSNCTISHDTLKTKQSHFSSDQHPRRKENRRHSLGKNRFTVSDVNDSSNSECSNLPNEFKNENICMKNVDSIQRNKERLPASPKNNKEAPISESSKISVSYETRRKHCIPNHSQTTTSCSQQICSPPIPRPCQAATHVQCPQKSATSNVPSWMKQTISRILASTSPPYSRKQASDSQQVPVKDKPT